MKKGYNYTNTALKVAINERIHSKRDRAVMFDRYANGLTYEQLADKYDISVNTVKRIIHKYDFILIKISE